MSIVSHDVVSFKSTGTYRNENDFPGIKESSLACFLKSPSFVEEKFGIFVSSCRSNERSMATHEMSEWKLL